MLEDRHPVTVALVLIVVILLIIAGPLWTIGALNLLFGLAIPKTFFTWLSVLWLQWLLIGSKVQYNKEA